MASSTKSSTSTVKDYETSTTTPATATDTTTEHDSFSTTSDDDHIEKDTKTSTRFVYIYSSTDYTQTDFTTEMVTSSSTDAISTTQTKEYTDPNNQFSSTYDDFTAFSTTDDKIINTVKHTTEETSSPFVEPSSTIIKTEHTPSQTVTNIPSTTEGLDEIKMSTSRIWDIISSTVVNILCPEPNGYFPHPTDKHKFVGCVDGNPSVLECPEDLIYKHRIRACDYE
ncbi:Endochitinase, partial [Stegodyphus mimosarum]